MKKFFVLALVALVCGTASAQIVSSTSREITTVQKVKAPSNKVKYLQASIGFLTASGEDTEDLENATGFDFLYGFEKPLGNDGVWWGMEIGIGTSRGYYFSAGEGRWKTENTLRTYSLRYMPLNFGYRYRINEDVALEAHVGAGLSVDFAGGFTVEVDDETETTSIWDLEDEDWMPADVFLKLGVGVQYKSVGLDLSWQKGFLEPIEDCEWKASNVFLGVRYVF